MKKKMKVNKEIMEIISSMLFVAEPTDEILKQIRNQNLEIIKRRCQEYEEILKNREPSKYIKYFIYVD